MISLSQTGMAQKYSLWMQGHTFSPPHTGTGILDADARMCVSLT